MVTYRMGGDGWSLTRTKLGFKLKGGQSSLFKNLKKIGISILEVNNVALLALIY